MHEPNNKNIRIVWLAAVVLAIVILIAPQARAGFWGDVWQGIKNNIAPGGGGQNVETSEGIPAPKQEEEKKAQAQEIPLYKPALDYEKAIVAAVKKSAPAVVAITVSKNVPTLENCKISPYSPFSDLPPEFQEFFGGGLPQFNRQECEQGTKLQEVGGGSGFIISTDGLILTNKHVVADTKATYTVFTNDGKKYDAKVLARDPLKDLAVLRIEKSSLPIVTLGDSDSIELGQTAISIGNALGEFRNTVSVGVVSGLARTVQASGPGVGTETIHGVIQTDAAINPGNSGGPLLNLKGEVIGINTAVVSGAQNIGFAIPINDAKRDIQSVKKTGEIQSAYLGVRYIGVTSALKEKEKLSVDYGALLRGGADGPAVTPDSPAQKAGLLAEDIILSLNGKKITTEQPLGALITNYGIGDTITLEVRRGEQTLTVRATLAKRPTE
ncbi:MAG: trypsin-like peptidase domain-containing protein [Candidatus Liptonbacteria bacterium]